MAAYQLILFDLDGTITDSKPGIKNAILYSLSKVGIDEDPSNLKKFYGPPLEVSFSENYPQLDPKQMVGYYRDYYSRKGIFESKLFDGALELLKKLKHADKTVVVATSKPDSFAKKVLDIFQLNPFFKAIYGSNLDGTRIKKDEIIKDILDDHPHIPKEQVVMVGDRKHDIIGATENQIDSIFVSYGYAVSGELDECQPTNIVESIDDLEEILI